MPENLRGAKIPGYLQNRFQMQKKHLGSIRASLGRQILAYVPEMERDITGLAMIERLARQLFESP